MKPPLALLLPLAALLTACATPGMTAFDDGVRLDRAIADLRGAVMAEPDATRRARIDRLLRVLEASR